MFVPTYCGYNILSILLDMSSIIFIVVNITLPTFLDNPVYN